MTKVVSKTSKKALSLILSILMIFSCFSLSVAAKSPSFDELTSTISFNEKASRFFMNSWKTIIKKSDLQVTKVSVSNIDMEACMLDGGEFNATEVSFDVNTYANTLVGKKNIAPESAIVYYKDPAGTVRQARVYDGYCRFYCIQGGTYEMKVVVNDGEFVVNKNFTVKNTIINYFLNVNDTKPCCTDKIPADIASITSYKPQKSGYKFLGWAEKENGIVPSTATYTGHDYYKPNIYASDLSQTDAAACIHEVKCPNNQNSVTFNLYAVWVKA